jgi:hypothetical protein
MADILVGTRQSAHDHLAEESGTRAGSFESWDDDARLSVDVKEIFHRSRAREATSQLVHTNRGSYHRNTQ